MGIINKLLGRATTPRSISDLLGICQEMINSGKYQEAARIAHSFIVQYRANHDFSDQENLRRQAYGYYMLCKATVKQIESCSDSQRYEFLIVFFGANSMARTAFLRSMGWRAGDSFDNDFKDHADYPFAKGVREMYDKIYNTYEGSETERADIYANEQLSAHSWKRHPLTMNNKRPQKFTDILRQKYRWPKKGGRLLQESQDWDRGVDFAQDKISRHVHIWSGYIKAGSVLIDVCQQYTYERNFLIYPALFNYRHGIEQAMKWIVMQYGHYSNVEINDFENHDLWQLWQLCKQIIIEVGSEESSILVVEQIIKDFHDLDKYSLAFRYAHNKDGSLIILPEEMIDVENIQDVMESISHFFEGVDGQLNANSSAIPDF